MSWQVVAKQVLLDPYRSRYLWVSLGVVCLLFGGVTNLISDSGVATVLLRLGAFIVPPIALVSGYRTIAESYQSGSLRVVLSYPHTRRDVVLGTAVGQSLLTVLLVTVGVLVAGVVALFKRETLALEPFLFVWLAAILLGISMSVLAVGISAAARTVNRAAIGAFGSLLLFFGGWNMLPVAIRYVLNGFARPTSAQPAWVDVFVALNPTRAFLLLTDQLPRAMPTTGDGVHTTAWFGLLVLVGWALIPFLLGLWLFERRDL